MRRVLLIFLSLVLALVGWSAVGADDGFYVIPAMRGNYAPVPKTGQTTPSGTGTDGALKKGVAWPTPRFTDNQNGTVTDNLTKLIWTKNANMFGGLKWQDGSTYPTYPACEACATLNSEEQGLTDGSKAGDWRLPNVRELQSLIDYGKAASALPWPNPFTGDQSGLYYWSSTTSAYDTNYAWCVYFGLGFVDHSVKSSNGWVWCVRGGP